MLLHDHVVLTLTLFLYTITAVFLMAYNIVSKMYKKITQKKNTTLKRPVKSVFAKVLHDRTASSACS